MKTLGAALLILMLGTLAACKETECIPENHKAVVVSKGQVTGNACYRGGNCSQYVTSAVKARDTVNNNTYICRMAGDD